MSIKIEIDAATGAEARLELLNLLGAGQSNWAEVGIDPDRAGSDVTAKVTIQNGEVTDIETTQEETPVKGKRRTKAQIEADNKPVEDNEPDTSQAPAGPVDAQQATNDKEALETGAALADTVTEFPTLPELQRACAVLVRAGYKKEGIDMVKNIGGAETSKDVPEDKRQVLIDALTKFAEDNKIAL